MLHCEIYSASVYDRGGTRLLGSLGKLSRVRWERLRDDVSQASVDIATRTVDCDTTLGLAAAGRSELVIFRGDERVWEGPITHISYKGGSVSISARDVVHYLYRAIMKSEYNNAYPNIITATERIRRILLAELQRFEAQDPPVNVWPHVVIHEDAGNAKTSSHTLRYQYTVFEHMDALAARGGIDYCAVGRAIHVWDVHKNAMGQTAVVSENDFLGEVVITEYGMELATVSAITDGKGNVGIAGAADPYYGLVEILDTAYDESTGDDWDEENPAEPPSVADMREQAARVLMDRNPTPIVVRVPDNSTLNPRGTLSISDLVPGVFIPLQATLPGKSMSQMQKLDKVSFEEVAGKGETIKVILSPAPDVGA